MSSKLRQRAVFSISVLLLLVVWLAVLPAAAQWPVFRSHIDRNREYSVNANAMYYTELEGVRFLDLYRPEQ